MRFSVVVTTWSDAREDLLHRNLAALAAQTVTPYETIVVVDHNPRFQARLAGAWPAVDVIASGPVRGAAGARNAGTARATGDAVAFLDDDARPAATWLEELAAAYAHEDVAGVGGTLRPGWPAARPWWFPEEFDWVVGCTYRGLPTRRAPVRNLIGANMSFRRDLLLGVGGERDGFGRVGLAPVACEETELCIRVRASRPRRGRRRSSRPGRASAGRRSTSRCGSRAARRVGASARRSCARPTVLRPHRRAVSAAPCRGPPRSSGGGSSAPAPARA